MLSKISKFGMPDSRHVSAPRWIENYEVTEMIEFYFRLQRTYDRYKTCRSTLFNLGELQKVSLGQLALLTS